MMTMTKALKRGTARYTRSGTLFFQIALFIAASFLVVGCGCASKQMQFPLRIEWWHSEQEVFAYVFQSVDRTNCMVAVERHGRVLDGSLVNRSLPDLLSLASKAQQEAGGWTNLVTDPRIEIRRLVVNHGLADRRTFALQGPLADVLKGLRASESLHELVDLAGRDQAKGYRLID